MYKISTDTYVCDFCGFEEKWDAHDDIHGDLWGCEICEKTFCSKCLKEKVGEKIYKMEMQSCNNIACPDCATETYFNELIL